MFFQWDFDPQTYWLDPVLRSRGTIGNAGINFEFAAFMIDVHIDQDELSNRIQNDIFPQLLEHYKPFVEAYPFLSEPNPIELDGFGNGGLYIHGEILCPDGIDADLLYGLLYEFLLKFDSLFIHVASHILLAFDSETILPDEDLEISMNRFWFNQGRILYISPLVFRPGEDIFLEDSLEFIQKNVHKCIIYGSVFKKGEESVYLRESLEGIVDVSEVRIPRALASVYNRYPWLIPSSFTSYYSDNSLRSDGDGEEVNQTSLLGIPSVSNETEFVSLHVGVPDWIATFVAQQADESLALVLVAGFDKLLRKSAKLSEEYKNIRQFSGSESIDLSRIKLQNKLMSRGRLDRVIPPKKFTFDEKEGGVNDDLISKDQEKLMSQMTEFLKDEAKVRNLFEKDDQEEDGEEDSNDESAAEYFRKEGVDIDEDDFFEFFLRNALKVEKGDLSNYIAETPSANIERKRVYNNDSEYTSDEEEFPASYRDVVDLEEYDDDDLEVLDSFANMRTS